MREPGIERGHAMPARLREIAQSAKRSSVSVLAQNWRGDLRDAEEKIGGPPCATAQRRADLRQNAPTCGSIGVAGQAFAAEHLVDLRDCRGEAGVLDAAVRFREIEGCAFLPFEE